MTKKIIHKGYKITAYQQLKINTFVGGQDTFYDWVVKINDEEVTLLVCHAGNIEAQIEEAKQVIDAQIEQNEFYAGSGR